MKKVMFSIVISVCLLFSFSVQAGTYLKSCDGCSSLQKQRMAESVIDNGAKVLVFDAVSVSVSAYRISRRFVDDHIDVSLAREVDVPTEIVESFKDAISYKAEYISALKRDFGSLIIPFNQLSISVVSTSKIASTNKLNNESPTAYDFMSNSSLRRNTFNELTENYPTYDLFRQSINALSRSINIDAGGAFGSITIDLSGLEIEPKITFDDGSYVNVKYNYSNDNFDTISGVDAAANDIPQAGDALGGQYNVSSSEQWAQFQEYSEYFWRVEFFGQAQEGQACGTKCTKMDGAKWKCVIKCN